MDDNIDLDFLDEEETYLDQLFFDLDNDPRYRDNEYNEYNDNEYEIYDDLLDFIVHNLQISYCYKVVDGK